MTILERLRTTGRVLISGELPQENQSQEKALKYAQQEKVSPVISFFDSHIHSRLTDSQTASTKLLLANEEWVYRNNDVIADEVAKLEFQLFKGRIVGDELVLNKIGQHPVLALLDRFNEATSRADGLYNTQSHKKLVGDSFWLLDNPTMPENVYLLNPTKVTVKIGDFTKQGSPMVDGYQFKDRIRTSDGKDEDIDKTYKPEEIIHFKTPNPNKTTRGLGAVEAAAKTIDTDSMANEAQAAYFKRGAITNFVLVTEQKLNDQQKKALRAELRSNYTGVRNAYRAMLLSNGLKPENIQMSNKDLEFISQLKWYRDKIMIIFGNNPAVLGIIEDVNRANSESSIRNWKATTVASAMASIVNTLNEFLLPKFGDGLILGFADPVPEDRGKKIEENIKLKKGGIITRNEAREDLGYDTVEGGDEFDDSFSLTNLTDDKKIKKQLPTGLKHVDYKSYFRREGFHAKILAGRIDKQTRVLAKAIAKKKKKQRPKGHSKIDSRPRSFTKEQIEKYYWRQMAIVDAMENQLENKALQFVTSIVEEGLSNVDDEDARQSGKLVDTQQYQSRGQALFEPVLRQIGTQAGNEAYNLIGVEEPYIPKDITKGLVDDIRESIIKFVDSTIDDAVNRMTTIIVEGLREELSIPQIKRRIRDMFFGKGRQANIKAERIARTETIKASNGGIQDAFEQSGVVTGKEWLAELDDRTTDICEYLNGKIVSLDDQWFGKGQSVTFTNSSGDEITYTADYEDVKYPPAHANCRSTLIPVIVGQRAFKYTRDKITQLKTDVDKRTKAYKKLESEYEQKKIEDAEYIRRLEILAGINQEDAQE